MVKRKFDLSMKSIMSQAFSLKYIRYLLLQACLFQGRLKACDNRKQATPC